MLTKSQGSAIKDIILEGEGIGSSAHEQAWHVQRCMTKHDKGAGWGWGVRNDKNIQKNVIYGLPHTET